jgi:lipopolysaccharide heptosyltransferase II
MFLMPQKNYTKILVVNPYGIGDVLFTTPLISNLKEQCPESKIGFVVGSRTREIIDSNDMIDDVYVFDKGYFDTLNFFNALRYLINFCRPIKKAGYEVLFDLSNSSQYGLIEKFFLNIPRRIGFNYKNRGRYLTDKIKIEGFSGKHVVEYYLSLLNIAGLNAVKKDLLFPVEKSIISKISKYLTGKNIEEDALLITLVPAGGSSWGDNSFLKQWPAEKYAQLADKLIQEFRAQIVIAGSCNDAALCKAVRKNMESDNALIINNFSLCEFAALCNLSDLVVCNDGGPLHIAVSQKTPTLSFFGPVDEKVYGPYDSSARHVVLSNDIACRPCYINFKFKSCKSRECLNLITVDKALNSIQSLINK